MTPDEVEAHCLSLPAATLVVQWGGTRVFKVGGKMFAAVGGVWPVAFKASDMAFALLPEQGLARPAAYLARAGWLSVDDPAAWDAGDLKAYLTDAHRLVAARLPRKARVELGFA